MTGVQTCALPIWSADGKGFHAAKFDGNNKSSLDYYNMNNLVEYKKFREKDYFISF